MVEMERRASESRAGSEKKRMEEECSAASNAVRWEKFLPRMVLRVLLVEADDSTRQIIAALLRKCSYKVAAVSDGLKAWEVLKGRAHQIDLILTEVELPSISGFALLTLIMEHEICKNIPVIMMSVQDSISTVYKCMLRGASDFLVKPVRKNELQNLWQHVWRKQTSTSSGHIPQEENDAQQKVEVTAENNATSNHSSGYVACIQQNGECIEKGSDAQSSCAKPDMEVEGEYLEHVDCSKHNWTSKSLSGDVQSLKQREVSEESKQMPMPENEAKGSSAGACKKINEITHREDAFLDNRWGHNKIVPDACRNDHVIGNFSGEAIDLIGAFDSYPGCTRRSYMNDLNKVDCSPLLDLSLRRSHPSGSVNQITDDRHRLKQSDASAFSRYISRPTQQHQDSASVSATIQHKNNQTNSYKDLSNHEPTLGFHQSMISMATGQGGHNENLSSSVNQRIFPIPVPVEGLRLDNVSSAYGSVMPHVYHTQSVLSPLQIPVSSSHLEHSIQKSSYYVPNSEVRSSQEFHKMIDKKGSSATDQTENKQGHKLESLEDRGCFSSATDQSASSSLCNGALSHLNSVGSGSNAMRAAAECGNEVAVVNDGNCNRSLQREAALAKFRMKRKDRCYEKKVRYESRKKLAEQRPRVKGQFVRQIQTSEPVAKEINEQTGNLSHG